MIPVLGPAPTPLPCVHWHADTFSLPDGAVRLARNDAYENQAFRLGPRAYGLQFHVEVTASLVAHWGPHLPPGMFVRASDVAHVSRAGDGIVRRLVALAGAGVVPTGRRLARHLAQHVLEDPAVAVVLRLHRGVDAHDDAELGDRVVVGRGGHRELLGQLTRVQARRGR